MAWDHGAGACQDFAHLTLRLLRTMGIPARYVSGYLHPFPDAGIGQPISGESHAWVEWWDGSWRPVDPTSGVPRRRAPRGGGPGPRPPRRDPPLKGLFKGGQLTAWACRWS